MVQVIQGKEGFGSLLGRNFSEGLKESLSSLAQSKLQSLVQSSQAPAFVDAAIKAGISPEIANFMAHLPPAALTAFAQKLGPGDFGQQQEQAPSLASELQQLAPEQPQEQQGLFQQQQQGPRLPPLSGEEAIMRALQEYQQQQQPQQQQQQMAQKVAQQQQQQMAQQQQAQPQQKKPANALEILARPSQADIRHQQDFNQREKFENRKENKKYIDTVLDREDANDKDLAVLERIIHLRDADKVQTGLVQFFKLAGFDITALKNADTNELEKLTNWFLRGGTKLFGGKVSNQEMMAIINSVPNALQNKEAAKQLANQMITQKKWENEEGKTIRKLRKEYGEKGIPYDFRDVVKERMEDTNKRYHEAFVKGIPIEDVGKTYSGKQLSDASKFSGFQRRNRKTGKLEEVVNGKWVPVKG